MPHLDPSASTQTAHTFTQTTTHTTHLDYWPGLPSDYDSNPDQPYPLMLFLHGAWSVRVMASGWTSSPNTDL
jgi:predicted peptidase